MEVTVKAPPVKMQGIKTKLVPFIRRHVQWDEMQRWVEPFAGSCAVAFNMRPKRALLADKNPHLIRFYQDIQSSLIKPDIVAEYLSDEGAALRSSGQDHYYKIRTRFNDRPSSLDFLFLNRACFNGVMRFNKRGGFNVPFCKKPDRFRSAYVTKIVNQIKWVRDLVAVGDYEFRTQDCWDTLAAIEPGDFVYVDPPYAGRHTDYFCGWSEEDEQRLALDLSSMEASFALSSWLRNKYRENGAISRSYSDFPVRTHRHFYHVGSFEENRNEMTEILILSKDHAHDHPEDVNQSSSASAGLFAVSEL